MPELRQIATEPGLVFDVMVDGPSNGPPVLLLHGFAESFHMWRAQLAALAGAGFRAGGPRPRGFIARGPRASAVIPRVRGRAPPTSPTTNSTGSLPTRWPSWLPAATPTADVTSLVTIGARASPGAWPTAIPNASLR